VLADETFEVVVVELAPELGVTRDVAVTDVAADVVLVATVLVSVVVVADGGDWSEVVEDVRVFVGAGDVDGGVLVELAGTSGALGVVVVVEGTVEIGADELVVDEGVARMVEPAVTVDVVLVGVVVVVVVVVDVDVDGRVAGIEVVDVVGLDVVGLDVVGFDVVGFDVVVRSRTVVLDGEVASVLVVTSLDVLV
jgi:hypothetical protein